MCIRDSITTVWAPHDQPNHVENRTWLPGIEKVLGDAFTAAFKNKKVMGGLNHNYQAVKKMIDEQGVNTQPVVIEDDVWVGANSVILPGVTLGKHCVVAVSYTHLDVYKRQEVIRSK